MGGGGLGTALSAPSRGSEQDISREGKGRAPWADDQQAAPRLCAVLGRKQCRAQTPDPLPPVTRGGGGGGIRKTLHCI